MSAEAIRNDSQSQSLELEHSPGRIALITGGGGAIGSEVSRLLALQGKKVLIGTRDRDKFDKLRSEIENSGGLAPAPFIGDLTNPSEVARAYEESGLKPGQTIDYYPLAAAGLEAVTMDIARVVGTLRKQLKSREGITLKDAQEATQRLHSIMTRESVMETAKAINQVAPMVLGRELAANNNLNSSSKIVYLGSTISEYTREILEGLDPSESDQINERYPGPEIYRIIGIYKALGIIELQGLARNTEATYYNFVAPGVEGTPIGDLFGKLTPVLEAVHGLTSEEPFEFPEPTTTEVAHAIVAETDKQPISHDNTIYVGYQPGQVTRIKPANFRTPIIDLL